MPMAQKPKKAISIENKELSSKQLMERELRSRTHSERPRSMDLRKPSNYK